jgi:hypothetical protein
MKFINGHVLTTPGGKRQGADDEAQLQCRSDHASFPEALSRRSLRSPSSSRGGGLSLM